MRAVSARPSALGEISPLTTAWMAPGKWSAGRQMGEGATDTPYLGGKDEIVHYYSV
jgi:hypothetical protein